MIYIKHWIKFTISHFLQLFSVKHLHGRLTLAFWIKKELKVKQISFGLDVKTALNKNYLPTQLENNTLSFGIQNNILESMVNGLCLKSHQVLNVFRHLTKMLSQQWSPCSTQTIWSKLDFSVKFWAQVLTTRTSIQSKFHSLVLNNKYFKHPRPNTAFVNLMVHILMFV